MNNKNLLFLLAGLITGSAIGFLAGYSIMKKRNEEEKENLIIEYNQALKEKDKRIEEEKIEKAEEKIEKVINNTRDKFISKPAKIATDDTPGVNYTMFSKKVSELGYDAAEKDLEENPEKYSETEVEREERENNELNAAYDHYKEIKGNKIEILGNDEIDEDYPDIIYDSEEVYYLIPEDKIYTEFGEDFDEETHLGVRLRKVNWFTSDQNSVWVRNNPEEKDYRVVKHDMTHDDFFSISHNEEIESMRAKMEIEDDKNNANEFLDGLMKTYGKNKAPTSNA